MAIQFYQDEDYEKAIELFSELFEANPSSSYFYEYYFQSLIKAQAFDRAEKMLKKQVRRSDKPGTYRVDLGYLYKLADEPDESEETYQEALEEMPGIESRVLQVANTFYRRGELDYAIEAYKKGRKRMGDPTAFRFQLANVYLEDGQMRSTVIEYLNAVEEERNNLSYVKNRLQQHFDREGLEKELRLELLARIQLKPDEDVYADLLSWYYIQKKDFEAAFRQLKALDQRNPRGKKGELVELGKVAASNQAYDAATKIYQYILEEDERGPFYFKARRELMDVRYRKIQATDSVDMQGVQALESEINSFLESYQNRLEESASLVRQLAEIKANYLDKTDEAIALLEEYVSREELDKQDRARMKLALGDYYLLKGDPWEATLYYGQVEKSFRDHPLGHEAKFRGAKLAFYRGDFEFAQAKLKVLKGSTSELIANNALELSLLIQDNLGLDTSLKPMQMYAHADLLIFKHQYRKALDTLSLLRQRFPNHSLTDEILFAQAKIYERQRRYEEAVEAYTQVANYRKNNILADNALYRLGMLHQERTGDTAKALEAYEDLIFNHKGSVFVVDARKRYRRLRGDAVN